MALSRGGAPRAVPRGTPALRGALPRTLSRRPRARCAAYGSRRRHRDAARALRRELGVYLVEARERHRRAGRPLLRLLARRDAGLCHAVSIGNRLELAAVQIFEEEPDRDLVIQGIGALDGDVIDAWHARRR